MGTTEIAASLRSADGTPEVWLVSEVRTVVLESHPLTYGGCANPGWLVPELNCSAPN